MDADEKMQWIQAKQDSQARRMFRAVPIGELLTGVSGRDAALEKIRAAVRGVTDDVFEGFCRVVSLKDGMLVIEVSAPTVLYFMRSRWDSVLLAATRKASSSISRIYWKLAESRA